MKKYSAFCEECAFSMLISYRNFSCLVVLNLVHRNNVIIVSPLIMKFGGLILKVVYQHVGTVYAQKTIIII